MKGSQGRDDGRRPASDAVVQRHLGVRGRGTPRPSLRGYHGEERVGSTSVKAGSTKKRDYFRHYLIGIFPAVDLPAGRKLREFNYFVLFLGFMVIHLSLSP